jgi:hypothetical protein
MVDIGHKHPGAHHVCQRRSSGSQGSIDVMNRLNRLQVGIAFTYDLSVGAGRRGSGDVNPVSCANRPGIPDDRLPRGSAGNKLALICHTG